jgi:hypothetical protein
MRSQQTEKFGQHLMHGAQAGGAERGKLGLSGLLDTVLSLAALYKAKKSRRLTAAGR